MKKQTALSKHSLIISVDKDETYGTLCALPREQADFSFVEAYSKKEVFELIEKYRPDALLLDLMMPEIDGLALIGEINNTQGGSWLPIIIVTANQEPKVIAEAFEAGVTDYFIKPVNPLLLAYRLRSTIKTSKAIFDLNLNSSELEAIKNMAELCDWQLDVGNNQMSWSSQVCHMFGLKQKKYSGDMKAFWNIVHSDDLLFVKKQIEDAIKKHEEFQFEHRIKLPEGTQKIIEQKGKVLQSENGNSDKILFSSKDITDLKKAEEEIKLLAFYDNLTELPNRLLFKEHLGKAVYNAKRTKGLLAVLFIDIDNFRFINDTFGRKAGDELLTIIAERLRECLRENDTAAKLDNRYDLTARFGADEFAVILEELKDLSDAAIVARRIIKSLGKVITLDDHEVYLHSRIGVSVFPDDGDRVDLLMNNADVALSRAKELEKDSYQFFTADLNSRAFAKFAMETRLRKAIDDEEFLLFYQPQVDLSNGRISSVEALIRWDHPELGIISPMEFIPIAEATGLIIPIGEWVIRTACQQCNQWQKEGKEIRVSINLSARQFDDRSIVHMISNTLNELQVNPALLEFEITESMLMGDVETSISTMKRIKDLGVRLSIDDFGTGYSSLNYLKKFPVNALKVDRSFVSDILTSKDDAMIVKAIVTLAKNLGLEVIAEGIEESDHLHYLRQLGCEYAQGFFISRPVSAVDFMAFVDSWNVKGCLKKNYPPTSASHLQ